MGCARSTRSIRSQEVPAAASGTCWCRGYARSYVPMAPMMASSWATSRTGYCSSSSSSSSSSNNNPTPLPRFYSEFGERIDHQRFSFRSLTDLVRAIPSVVVFYDTGAISPSFQHQFSVSFTPACDRPLQQCCVPWAPLQASRHALLRAAGCAGVRQQRRAL